MVYRSWISEIGKSNETTLVLPDGKAIIRNGNAIDWLPKIVK